MPKFYVLLVVLGLFTRPVLAADTPIVDLQTNYGTITLQLAADKSPLTVANFLTYVNESFYENTLFHRVVAGFMIQGGGFSKNMVQKPTHAAIKLESNNGLSNLRGTIAMARTSVADSATSQFFINSVDNTGLNYQSTTKPGYAVFGQVTEGIDVVDKISSVTTSINSTTGEKSVPVQSVIIEAARVREAQLSFTNLKPLYQPGETLAITLQENTIARQRALDLWVAVRLESGEFLFISPENTESFSRQAKPFKRKVSISETQQTVLSFVVPSGLAGKYILYAIFNEPDSDATDLTHYLRSNLASASLELR